MGDLNADGYADAVMAAPAYGIDQGRVYVFLGTSEGLDVAGATTRAGDAEGANMAVSVAALGDVDDDGYDDVAVGASGEELDAGRVLLYRGSATGLEDTPTMTLDAPVGILSFGSKVAAAGDVDGDGHLDLAVRGEDEADGTGRVFVYRGGTTGLDASSEVELECSGASTFFGTGLSTAGDVDGDGYDDVIVGDSHYSSGGRAWIYRGSAGGIDATVAQEIDKPDSGHLDMGAMVAGGQDLNGDGYGDVVVSAPAYSDDRGRAYVFYGSAELLDLAAPVRLKGEAAYNDFSDTIALVGDVNGDGFPDVAVGASGYDGDGTTTTDYGRAYLYTGSVDGIHNVDRIIIEAPDGATSFGGVAALGDTDGDGLAELALRAPEGEGDYDDVVYVYAGATTWPDAAATVAWQEESNAHAGASAAGVGDVDGDGYDDLLVGAPQYRHATGRALLFLGSASGLPDTPSWTVVGSEEGQELGHAVAAAGDVDGDGYDDVLVSSAATADGPARVELYRGSAAGLEASPTLALFGEGPAEDEFGWQMEPVGDVDGDGYADVVISALRSDSKVESEWLYRGSADGLETTGALLYSATSGWESVDIRVAGIGDVDADGDDDVAIGTPYTGDGSLGQVDLYMGSAAGLGTSPVLTLSDADFDYFGYAVAGVGDVNGDGYDDLAVGVWDSGGEIVVYTGSATGISAASAVRIVDRSKSLDFFGEDLAGVGDMDGDGYDDIAVSRSAYELTTGEVVGAVEILPGGPTGPTDVPLWTFVGDMDHGSFSKDFWPAGDTDGDGLRELVVGCARYQEDAGQVFLYGGGGDTGGGDTGGGDTGRGDTGASDGGASDTGASDGGGTATDGGTSDTGASDGGTSDGGAGDSGSSPGKTGCSTVAGAGAPAWWAILALAGLVRRRRAGAPQPGGRWG